MMPVFGDEVLEHISRCAACQSPTPLIAVHSQSIMVPECPKGWNELWTGFSFVMVRIETKLLLNHNNIEY